MSDLQGNGLTTTDAKTGQRISANVELFFPWPQPDGVGLNARFATEVPGPSVYNHLNDPGYAFANAGVGPGHVIISKAGYETLEFDATLPLPTNINYALTPLASSPSVLHLEVRGRDFVDANGQPACYACVDQFQALRLMIDGELGRLDDLAGESLALGFNWWRVMLMGDISQNTLFSLYPSEAKYRDCLYELPRWANRKGIGILGEAHADNQVVKANQTEQWKLVTDAFRGTISIPSGGNEYQKNGFDPFALANPGMIATRGSNLADELTPQNGFACASFHQRTDYPKTLYDATASVLYMEEQGYTVCLMDEPTRFNLDGSTKTDHLPADVSPARFAWQLAKVYSAMWDLACFHNQAGQRGILMPPPLLKIAEAWQRGMLL